MSKSRVFFYILISFIAGVFWRSFWDVNQNMLFLSLLFSLILLFVFYKNKILAVSAFVVIFLVWGIWQTDSAIRKTQNLELTGKILEGKAMVENTRPSSFGQNIIVELLDKKISILISTAQYPEYAYGDLLHISCLAKAIENKDSEFDYQMYMAKEGVLYQCDKSKINITNEKGGSRIYAAILKIRNAFENNINKVIPQPEGALAGGLLFGGNAGLSKEIQNDFSRTGMTHIVAVSGYNVTIIAEYLIILAIAFGLWRRQAIWFALVGITLFVIMSGLPASAVRAGVMGGTLLWAMKNGRLASSENAIIFAAAVMLWMNPLLLRYDVGFQLSFLATLGIVVSSPFWEKSFIKKHRALGISEAIALSLSAQIFVLPIIAYNFHITSLISLLANVFILPIIPLSMLLVFLVSLSGFIFAPLSLVLAWLAFLALTYEIKLIHILAAFPWASVSIEKVSAWWIVVYYIIIISVVIFFRKTRCSEIEK